MRYLHRIRVEGVSEAADRLRLYLHKASFQLVPDSSAGYVIALHDGEALTLDSVDSDLERAILGNLQELDDKQRFPGCSHVTVKRGGGNQDPQAAVMTVPAALHEAVAIAVLRAVVQTADQPEPTPPVVIAAPDARRAWWKLWAILLCLFTSPVYAQQPPPFAVLDANTGATLNPRVFVGLFNASATGPVAVELPTTLSSGGFKVACVTGCSGGTTDADDASIATGQTTGLSLGLTQVYDGSVWRRLTIGVAGTASAQVLSVQGIAGGTNLNVNCAAGCIAGGSFNDNAAFTFGTTAVAISGYVVDDVAPNAATENSAAAARMSTNRVAFGIIRDAALNERGANVTAGNALVVDGSASTQPVSGTVTITDGAGAVNVICDSGCSGGTTDTDDASIATGQTTGINLGLTQVYDGSVWRRLTIGSAGTASAQVLTVQGIASATPVIVGDGAGALNVIVDSGSITADTELPAAAALSDTTANPTAPMVGSGMMVWDGSSNWVRAKGDANGLSVQGAVSNDGANVQNTKPFAIGCRASAAVPGDVSADNDAVVAWCLRSGAQAVQPTFGGVLGVAGNGVSGTGVQRVTIASDSTGQVALAAGSATIGALTANQSVNVAQINGVTTTMGNGVSGTGVQRVTLASDSTGVVGLNAGTNLIGQAATVTTATTTNGTATCYLTSAASTNSTNCKASAGNVYTVRAVNTTSTLYYVRMYNLAAAPTCSSATGFVETLPVPHGTGTGAGIVSNNGVPQAYDTGIGFCITGGGSSTDNTNAATGVYLTILYK